MALTAQIEDERYQIVRRLGLVMALDRPWTTDEEARFPWLMSIDPYGDTTLNYRQVKHVHRELAELVERVDDQEERDELKAMMGWIDQLPDEHLYLKLIGE